jgi:hypothetical protein
MMALATAGLRCRTRWESLQGLKSLLKTLEKQIPRGLKPARDDKNEGFVTARLKPRPFNDLFWSATATDD